MTSILGIELDGGSGRELRGDLLVYVGIRSERVLDEPYWLAWARVTELDDFDAAFSTMSSGPTESEAIAALEAKVRRLPGVLAALGAEVT